MFSIIIPTFNNINYLKLCLSSLNKNSKLNHEIIIHVNNGSDGTLDFVNKSKYKFTHSHENIGLCKAMNQAVKLSTKKYLVYAHDDMYFCPGWDLEFEKEINIQSDNKDFFLSGTMIQPFESFIYLDCGKNIDEFNEEKLLKNFNKINFNDFQGSTWAPSLIPLKTWIKVGGLSEEYGPGLGSDPDLNMKLWKIGVRLFKGLGKSRVYHFSSISLRKKVWNDGHKTFLLKWTISIKFFKKYYLRSNEFFNGELEDPKLSLGYIIGLLMCKLNFFFYKFFKS